MDGNTNNKHHEISFSTMSGNQRQIANDHPVIKNIQKELTIWNNGLRYLKSLANSNDVDEWYIKRTASDWLSMINKRYDPHLYPEEFIEMMQTIKKKTVDEMLRVEPRAFTDPVPGLVNIAITGEINKLIAFIDKLKNCISKI